MNTPLYYAADELVVLTDQRDRIASSLRHSASQLRAGLDVVPAKREEHRLLEGQLVEADKAVALAEKALVELARQG